MLRNALAPLLLPNLIFIHFQSHNNLIHTQTAAEKQDHIIFPPHRIFSQSHANNQFFTISRNPQTFGEDTDRGRNVDINRDVR
jgi:hypothetical protein